MALVRNPRRSRRGAAAVEFAVVLLFLVPLLMGLWEVGRLVEVEQHLNNAVREGARQASTGNKTTAQVQQDVINYLAANGITAAKSDVTVTNLTSSARNDPSTSVQLDRLRVEIKISFDSVRWVLLNQITTAKYLTASSDFYSMRDVPLAIDSTIPVN